MLSYMSKVKQNSQCNKVNAQFWNVMTIRIYIIHSKVDFLEKTAHFHVYHCNSPLYRGNIFYLRNDSSFNIHKLINSVTQLCPSPTPGAYSNSYPSSQWCHPTISSFIVSFSSSLQSFPASGYFSMSHKLIHVVIAFLMILLHTCLHLNKHIYWASFGTSVLNYQSVIISTMKLSRNVSV